MAKRGPTIYTPPSYLKRRMKEFSYCVRDKLNSFYGYDRFHLHDFQQLEDGDVLITIFDLDVAGKVLWVKWNHEKTSVDTTVHQIVNGEVDDHTEAWNAVEETIRPEDR